jgi:hypothetical protein
MYITFLLLFADTINPYLCGGILDQFSVHKNTDLRSLFKTGFYVDREYKNDLDADARFALPA